VATLNEETHGTAFTGAAGVVAVGGQIVVINDSSAQNAHIDTGAEIPQAGGGIDVTASGVRDVDTLAIGVGLGLVAAGAAISIVNVDGDTTATIGDVAVGTDVPGGGPVYDIAVTAYADNSPTAQAYSIQVGVGGSLSGAVALPTGLKTRASRPASAGGRSPPPAFNNVPPRRSMPAPGHHRRLDRRPGAQTPLDRSGDD
jgi:hypothetical protein